MRVRAKHWLNFDGVWHGAGQEFEISTGDMDALTGMVDIAETPVSSEPPVMDEEPPKRRGRPKKTDID